MAARLFIVRHGNTFAPGEAPRRIGARTDLPLVTSGRAQARALGEAFAGAGVSFARAWCGATRRTIETAELILAEMGNSCRPEPLSALTEIDHGPDEGRTEADVIARIGPEAIARWDRDAAVPPGWIVDAPSRIEGWRALLAEAGGMGGNVLCVTSNGAARFALLAADRPVGVTGGLKLRTGALGVIAMSEDGAPYLPCWDVRPGEPGFPG